MLMHAIGSDVVCKYALVIKKLQLLLKFFITRLCACTGINMKVSTIIKY